MKRWCTGLLSVGLVLVTGCAHAPASSFAQELAQVDYPAWILRGSGPAKVEDQRSFFGVGQVSGLRNVALARSTADNRARAELAQSFEIFAASALGAWVTEQESSDVETPQAQQQPASFAAPGGVTLLARPEEMSSEQLIKTLTAAALVSVQIVGHWFHPDDGAVFSQARLDLAQVTDSIGRVRELRPALRSWLQTHLPLQHEAMCAAKMRQDAALTGALQAP